MLKLTVQWESRLEEQHASKLANYEDKTGRTSYPTARTWGKYERSGIHFDIRCLKTTRRRGWLDIIFFLEQPVTGNTPPPPHTHTRERVGVISKGQKPPVVLASWWNSCHKVSMFLSFHFAHCSFATLLELYLAMQIQFIGNAKTWTINSFEINPFRFDLFNVILS